MTGAERPRARIAGTAVSVDHDIGGRRIASPDTFEVCSPPDWSIPHGNRDR